MAFLSSFLVLFFTHQGPDDVEIVQEFLRLLPSTIRGQDPQAGGGELFAGPSQAVPTLSRRKSQQMRFLKNKKCPKLGFDSASCNASNWRASFSGYSGSV